MKTQKWKALVSFTLIFSILLGTVASASEADNVVPAAEAQMLQEEPEAETTEDDTDESSTVNSAEEFSETDSEKAIEKETTEEATENTSFEVTEKDAAESLEEENTEGTSAAADDRTQALVNAYERWLSSGLRTGTGAVDSGISSFPDSYQSLLKELYEEHPNWSFVPVETGLDWNTVIEAESSLNVLQKTIAASILLSKASSDYNASTGEYIPKDGTIWVRASKPAVAYYMDPRNFLNEEYIFMFEALDYNEVYHTLEAVENILKWTDLAGTEISYLNTEGETIIVDPALTYAEAILAAGAHQGISPLYLASKIKNETGGKLNYGSISGQYSYGDVSYAGYYNFYNIGANDTITGSALAKGLVYAKGGSDGTGTSYGRPWTSPVLAIDGGAEYLASAYISKGQNTSYFQKFNTTPNSSYALYTHQYMTNLAGAAIEARTTYTTYDNLDLVDNAYVFYIPVYKNMPEQTSSVQISKSVKTAVTTSSVVLREGPSMSAASCVAIPAGAKVTTEGTVFTDSEVVVAIQQTYPYWTKVTYGSYTGYICTNYLQMDTDITLEAGSEKALDVTCSDSVVYFETSDPTIATVSSDGVITAVKEGICTIYVVNGAGKQLDAVGVKVQVKETVIELATPVLVSAVRGTGKVTVTWEQVDNALGYQVYRKEKGGSWVKLETIYPGTKVTYIDTTTKDDVEYIYTIRACNGSVLSGYDKAGITAKVTLETPVLVSAVRGTGKVTVTWEQVDNALGYQVYRKEKGGSWVKLETIYPGTKVTYIDATTKDDVEYIYTIRACNGSSLSGYNKTGITAKVALTTPVLVSAVNNNGAVVVTWKKVTNALGYQVYRKTGSGSWVKLGTVSSGSTITYKDITVSANTTYYYTIRAYNGSALSGYNKTGVKVTTPVAYSTYKTTTKINYRTGAGTSYSKAGTLATGVTVKIVTGWSKTANGYTWYKMYLNGKYYYVASKYLKLVSSGTTSSGSTTGSTVTYSTYKTTANVNYRTGAGTSYGKAGTLKLGTTVKIVNGWSKSVNGYTWYKMYLNGKYYYIVAKYLKKA